MNANTIVKVKVANLTKFGYADEQGYVSYSKNLSDHDKAFVVPGAEFEAELYTAPSGARYLNKIVARAAHVQAPKAGTAQVVTDVTPPVDVARAKKFTPKFEKKAEATSAGLTKDEWAAKDTRISRQGLIQAAVHALGTVVGSDSLFQEAEKLADQMLEYVNRK